MNESIFSPTQELFDAIQEKKSKEFIETLVTIGFVILTGYALVELLSKQ
ncbi:MAG: hypothetical protein HF967_08155 [Methanosarcinales archaeon]|nr:hypothetical protein [Methanosarcinales archaeon]